MSTRQKFPAIFGIAILCLIFLVTVVDAQTISGRLTTTVYSWQQRESDSTSADHYRAYQLAQFSANNLGLSGLSFHTYLNLSNDFGETVTDDPRVWIYNCYLNYKMLANSLDLSVGRQRIYAGVGYGTIDGMQIKYNSKFRFNIKLYAGTMAPFQKSTEIRDFNSDNLTWGVQVTTNRIKQVRIGLSYAHQSYVPVQYASPGKNTGSFRLDNPVAALQKDLLGLDVSSNLTKKISVNGRLDFNLGTTQVKRSEVGARYSLNRNLNFGLDYIYRMPMISPNSIFSVFAYNANQEVAFFTNYTWKDYRFFVNVSKVYFENDDNQRFGFGVSWKTVYLSYNNRAGYGGETNGLVASYRHVLSEKLQLNLSTNFAKYKINTSDKESSQLFSGVFGVSFTPSKTLLVQAEAQYLNNEWFSRDVRFFLKGSYAFFHNFRK